jgi:excisionase family DNA binding protein
MKSRLRSSSPTYYSTTDIAKLLGVNDSTIKRWADSGEIPCVKTLGGHRRFTHDHVRELTARMNINVAEAIRRADRGPSRC